MLTAWLEREEDPELAIKVLIETARDGPDGTVGLIVGLVTIAVALLDEASAGRSPNAVLSDLAQRLGHPGK